VNHDDDVVEVQGHDFKFDAAVVVADPDQSCVRSRGGFDVLGIDGVDHVHRVGLPDPVASGGAVPPELSVHTFIVAQNSCDVFRLPIGLRAADPELARLPHLIGDQVSDALLLGAVGGEGDEFLFGVVGKLEHDVLQVQVAEDGMA